MKSNDNKSLELVNNFLIYLRLFAPVFFGIFIVLILIFIISDMKQQDDIYLALIISIIAIIIFLLVVSFFLLKNLLNLNIFYKVEENGFRIKNKKEVFLIEYEKINKINFTQSENSCVIITNNKKYNFSLVIYRNKKHVCELIKNKCKNKNIELAHPYV